ncbi:MAG: hypothetical protein ACXAC8_10715 [Candidatus Hodarchaeales archaeon]
MIDQLKLRTEIANRMTSLGTALVTIKSHIKGEINIQLTCNEDAAAIKDTYSLLKDLQLFLEVSFY